MTGSGDVHSSVVTVIELTRYSYGFSSELGGLKTCTIKDKVIIYYEEPSKVNWDLRSYEYVLTSWSWKIINCLLGLSKLY